MSRLIVKSLPPNCTEVSLRKFYKKYGNLTDCTLKYTKEGKFRKFAFIGFESEDKAQKALTETHQAYMGSARLQVQECKPFGDSNKPRAWSQYSKDSSAFKRKHGGEESANVENSSAEPSTKKTKADPEFTKFLEAKGVNVAVEPDLVVKEQSVEEAKLMEELLEGIVGDTKLSLTFCGLPSVIKPKSLKEWLSPVRVKAMKICRNDTCAVAFVTFNRPPDVRRALLRDQEFIGGYKVTIKPVEEEEPEVAEAEPKDEKVMDAEAIASEEARVREEILDTGRLFVRNLPFSTKEDDLQFLFKKYGEISDVQVIVDKKTNKCKGFAIVEFVFPESAVAAYAAHDGKVFKGRMLHIIAGAEKKEPDNKDAEGNEKPKKEGHQEKSSFKQEKMAKLKANAGKSHSWNALFLGPNAIADTLAEKLGVGKADLLLSESGESAGVRLALAETRLVRETRDFLVANGVQLDAFSRPAAKRSDLVMLAKNLPAGVEAEELKRMFERHGDVKNVLIPPEGGVSALIVMGNRTDAKKAFQALAYSRFRTQPLYLEWAPGDVFGDMAKDETEEEKEGEDAEPIISKKEAREKRYAEKLAAKKLKREMEEKDETQAVKGEEDGEDEEMDTAEASSNAAESSADAAPVEDEAATPEDEGIEPGSTVFVKNLAFDTTDETLQNMFQKKFRIKSAQISKKLNPADPAKSLSMGFGFVQFFTKEAAEHAVKTLQGELLDGHCLELKISHWEVVDKGALSRKGINAKAQGQCTKLMVRNLPFQASIKEIENLFATFGEIRSIRIPKKVGSRDQHRGFGFVDFLSVGEAKRAFEALVHSTHLYGRRLVLEWAAADETVEELREKTADKFSGDKKAVKKQKQQIEAIEKDLANIQDD